ncbi:MAG: hypothetical protein GY771_16035 [bacterium]|nr:hypothetical protein [bacterium]
MIYAVAGYAKTGVVFVVIAGGDDEFIYRSLVEISLINLKINIPAGRIP